MFLINYLNRSDTDKIFPLFECIYAIELLIIAFALLLAYPLAVAVYSTRTYHRNIRLCLAVFIFHAVHCSISRLVIIAHQVLGPMGFVEPAYLIIASLNREAFKGYAICFTLVVACDRWIATLFWSWYESQRPSTAISFILLEIIQITISGTLSTLLITEIITDQDITLCYGILLVLAVACFISVLRYNKRAIRIQKRGAQIGSYSVSRSFQFNENVAIMQVLIRIAGPVARSCVPCFAFYGFYSNYPAGAGLDLLRFIAIALYDLWLEIIIKVAQQETNTYFEMLSRDLGSNQATSEINLSRR